MNYKLVLFIKIQIKSKCPQKEFDSIDYINSLSYCNIGGFNEILGKGYYTFFLGESALNEQYQRKLRMIEPNEKPIFLAMGAKTAFVILPDGRVSHLNLRVIMELCADNEELLLKIKQSDLKSNDVDKMFDILTIYNQSKKK